MPAKSIAQQKFMALVKSVQSGKSKAGGKANKAARDMNPSDVDDFASTKHDGLPYKVKKEEWQYVSEYANHNIHELWAETGTALDLGFYVPESIKKAFIETIEEAGWSYP